MHLWELACKFHVLINAKIQTCMKLIGNHAKKTLEACTTLLHILTQVIQTSCSVTYSCVQAVFKMPVSNTFPTHKTI